MIDVTKCLGCRKGIDVWTKQEDKLKHFDFFASADAGAIYDCETLEIEQYLEENENGMLRPKKEYDSFFANQSFWWEDILTLAYDVFQSPEEVKDFFNGGDSDNRMHNRSNEDIEDTLVNLADLNDIVVDEETYPDLKRFKTK
jgi:hypothetical protein